MQTNGSALPSARVVSIRLFLNREKYQVDENNVLLIPFGQLIAHDVSGLPNDVPKKNHGNIFVAFNLFDLKHQILQETFIRM